MKDKIIETSLKQFLKYGIRKISVQKLVAPMCISTKTVYKYFENKEDLLAEALRLYYEQQQGLMEQFFEGKQTVPLLFDMWYGGIENECKVNKTFFEDLNYYYPELERKIEATISKKIWKQFAKIIQQGIKEGVFREDLDPEIFLEGIAVLYTALARKGQFKKFHAQTNTLFLNTIAVYIRGFCTYEGIRQLDEHVKTFKIFEGMILEAN